MEQQALLDQLQDHYALPVLLSATPVTAGYLSRNWHLTAADRGYFLQEYRFAEITPVAAAHASLFHFQRAGIPTIAPLPAQDGQTIWRYADRFYALFPFVTARQLRRGALSLTAVQSIGTMLAQLHRAGQQVTLPHVQRRRLKDNRPTFQTQAQLILDLIRRQPAQSAFDQLAVQTLQRQLALVEVTAIDYATLALASDHLLHGDFHDGNLFFDEQEQVCYVFDWEKTEIAPREIELVRALLFICFSNPDNFCATFTPANFRLGEAFLAAYQAHYPVRPAQVVAALHARYWGSLCSLWVVEEHYLQHNRRVDPFLEATLAEITYFADHLSPFVTWLQTVLAQ